MFLRNSPWSGFIGVGQNDRPLLSRLFSFFLSFWEDRFTIRLSFCAFLLECGSFCLLGNFLEGTLCVQEVQVLSLLVFVQEVQLPSLEEGIGVLRLVGVWLWWGLGVFSKLVSLRLFVLGFC